MNQALSAVAPVGYQLLQLLGEGGAGSVYQAQQESTGQIVALKLLRQDHDADAVRRKRQIERFQRETQLCAQLHHAHIVRLLDKGQCADGQLFATFEYVPGETLKQYLLRKGALSALVAGELMGQVLDALACAHAQGIAHRDLKPQNVMVTHTGTRPNVKVLDFGIATFIPERQKIDYQQLTMTQETMGTPSYSAPEQLRGEPPTIKSDLYAWGLLFLECLTGKPVMQGLTLAEIFHKQLSPQDIALPPALIGHPLGELLRRVLQKSPRERPEQAVGLYADFKKINLANIVGNLDSGVLDVAERSAELTTGTSALMQTMEYLPGTFSFSYERSQITVLCCRLSVLAQVHDDEVDLDVLEALQRDQLSLCSDIAQRYGGYLAGSLGDTQMFYFGYPHASDTDARRAVRTALELASQVRRRSSLLQQQRGVVLDLGIGMHTGIVLVRSGTTPTGLTPNMALQLQRMAQNGRVLVSAATRRLLNQFAEFDESKVASVQASEQTLQYFPLLGEHSSEAFSFLRSGQARSFIGRSEELAKLTQAWQAAQQQGGTALLSGQAGIGKSRLAYELCELARKQGSAVADCRCFPEHQNNALHPFLQMLKNQLQLNLAENDAAAVQTLSAAMEQSGCKIEENIAILCSWLALPLPERFPASQLSPDKQKLLLLETLQKLILHMGRGKPLLLVVEDLHWIDLTSLELIQNLRRPLADMPCFLLLTSRPEFPPQIVDNDLALLHLKLQQLSLADSAQLLQTALPGKNIASASLEKLCQRADGIPLFAEELARMLEEKDLLLAHADGSYHLAPSFDSSDIPITLRDFLAARLGRLGSAKETAQLAAAIGREFEHALLLQIAPTDEASLQTEIEQLIAADIIYRQRRVRGDSYIFRHALIRDAAYDAMPRQFREQTHEHIAQVMAAAPASEVESNLPQLAYHFGQAKLYSQAVEYGSRAAHLALDRASHDDAIELANQVEAWLEFLANEEKIEASLVNNRVQTRALMYRFGWTDVRVKEAAERSLQLLKQVEPQSDIGRQHLAPSLWSLALYHQTANNRGMVRDLNRQLMAFSDQVQETSLAVACHTMQGISHWIDGNYLEAEKDLEFVASHYDTERDANHGNLYGLDSRVWSAATLANVQWFVHDDDARAFAYALANIEYARELQHIPSLGLALMYLSFLHHLAQDKIGAKRVCEEAIALAQKYGLPSVESYTSIVHSWACGELARGDAYLNGLKGLGCLLGMTYYAALGAETAAEQGNLDEALARVNAALELAEQTDEHYYTSELLRLRASYLPASEREVARADLQQAIVRAKKAGMRRSARLAEQQLSALQ